MSKINNSFPYKFKEIMKRAIYYASGLPLALEIIGSNLLGETLDEWDSALESYERIPNKDVQKILKVSYDSLDDNEKEIFLDLACFFRGRMLKYVTNILEGRGFHPKFGIGVLEKKSLIKVDRYNDEIVIMHDLIQSMGREIVRQQSTMPQKRNRLWFYEDIMCILEKNRENDEIEALVLDKPEDQEVQWNPEVFGKITSLRMLLIKKCSVRVLEWRGYPGTSLPSNFHPKNLSILNLSYSYFQWDKPLQNSKVLRQLILRGCQNIRRIPDISGLPNLTILCVSECENLTEIDDSIGSLHNLQGFWAIGCTKLKIVPSGIKLTSLVRLILRNCSSLAMFPEILAPMHKLIHVDVRGTAIENLPLSLQNLEGLQYLGFNRVKMFQSTMQFNFIARLPEFFPYLTHLSLCNSNLKILPKCIEEFQSLKCLVLYNCKKLRKIEGLPASIVLFSLKNTLVEADSSTLNMLLGQAIGSTNTAGAYFILPGQRIPKCFDHSSRGNSLCFWFRHELPFLTVCAVCGAWDKIKPPFCKQIKVAVSVHGADVCVHCINSIARSPFLEGDHICMVGFEKDVQHLMHNIKSALEMNEWIQGEVRFAMKPKKSSHSVQVIKWIGIHVNRSFSRMENVRFTDPYAPNNKTDVVNILFCEAPDIQQQQQSLALFNPTIPLDSESEEQSLNYVSSNSDSWEPPYTTHCSNGQAFLDHQTMASSSANIQNAKVQREEGTPISEISGEFTHQSRDSIEASMKLSPQYESHKVDQVETSLETKKNQFSKAMALVNELAQKFVQNKCMCKIRLSCNKF